MWEWEYEKEMEETIKMQERLKKYYDVPEESFNHPMENRHAIRVSDGRKLHHPQARPDTERVGG